MANYNNNYFGLDIGTTGIRLVQLFQRGEYHELLAAGSLPNNIDVYTCEDPEQLKFLTQTIDQLRKECGVTSKNVILGISEAHVYTQLIELPKLPDKQMEETIRWEAESFIPIPLDEVELDWEIVPIAGEKNKVLVFLLASPLIKLNKVIEVVQQANLHVINVESSLMASGRALIGKEDEKETVLLLNIGNEQSELGIIKNGLLLATRQIPLGGNTITKSLVSNLSLEWKLAEKTKLNLNNLSGAVGEKITREVNNVIDTLAHETQRSIHYFKEKFDDLAVTKIILTGRTAVVSSMVDVFAAQLNALQSKDSNPIIVQVGNPWKTIAKNNSIVEKSPEAQYSFSVALGLALKKI
ncbi:MAG: type IV pilus assembly protein PilM [bacterium]